MSFIGSSTTYYSRFWICKLDFLTQELNRETNTIGSKCQDLDITRIVVDMKAEIEKIREQIQNIE